MKERKEKKRLKRNEEPGLLQWFSHKQKGVTFSGPYISPGSDPDACTSHTFKTKMLMGSFHNQLPVAPELCSWCSLATS
jgi:hypothetical protein